MFRHCYLPSQTFFPPLILRRLIKTAMAKEEGGTREAGGRRKREREDGGAWEIGKRRKERWIKV